MPGTSATIRGFLISFDQALTINPSNLRALESKGILLVQMERPKEAIATFELLLQLQPMDYKAWSTKGDALVQLKRFQDVIHAYDCALEFNPNDFKAYSNRGNAFVLVSLIFRHLLEDNQTVFETLI